MHFGCNAVWFTIKEKYSGMVWCGEKEQRKKDGMDCTLGVVKFGLL